MGRDFSEGMSIYHYAENGTQRLDYLKNIMLKSLNNGRIKTEKLRHFFQGFLDDKKEAQSTARF